MPYKSRGVLCFSDDAFKIPVKIPVLKKISTDPEAHERNFELAQDMRKILPRERNKKEDSKVKITLVEIRKKTADT